MQCTSSLSSHFPRIFEHVCHRCTSTNCFCYLNFYIYSIISVKFVITFLMLRAWFRQYHVLKKWWLGVILNQLQLLKGRNMKQNAFHKKMVCTGNTIHIMKTWHMYPDTLSSKVNIQGSKIARERAREKNYLKITLIRYLTKFNEEWQNPRGCWQ